MEKEKFLLPTKITLLVFFILSLTYKQAFSQCTNPTPTGDISQVFCKADNNTIDDLVAIGGTIVWYDAPSGGKLYGTTEVLVNGTTYYADDISGDSCSTSRLAVTVTIYGDFPTNVDVFVGKCALDNPTIADLSASGENIAWYDAQFDGNLLTLSQLLVDGETYWVQQTENGCTSDRFPTTVSLIDPLTPTAAPIQSFCYPPNPTIADLQASGNTILWYESETSTTPLKTTTPLIDGEDYWAAEVTFPCVSSNRAQTTVVLDETPDAGESSSLTECEFNFVTTNLFDLLGGTPDTTGIWTGPSELANGYLGTFDPEINTLGTYTYTVSSVFGICPPDSATISIIITVVPPPTTTDVVQFFCEIENATVTDLSTNQNNVIWYDTETSTTALNPSEALSDGEDYWGALSDASTDCESAVRLKITVGVSVIPPPTTTETNQIFCEIEGATVEDLSADGSGTLWYDTETSTTPLSPSEELIDGEDYWASQTEPSSNCESAARIMVTTSVIVLPPPTTTEQNQIFCEIDNPKVENLSASETGILWYATETSTTPLNDSDLLVSDSTYWATQTDPISGCESASRLAVTVVINVTPPPTTTQENQSFCIKDYLPNAPIVSDLNAVGNEINWYADETSTTPLNDTDVLINDSYWATQTNTVTGCESASRLMVNVSVINPATPTTSEVNQAFCAADKPTVASLQASGTSIIWYANETASLPLNSTDFLITGEDYWAAASNASTGCESISRLMVTVSITDVAPATIDNTSQTFCESDFPTVENLDASGINIVWYASETETTPLADTSPLIDGVAYWAAQSNPVTGCVSSLRVVANVTLTAIPTPTLISLGNEFCKIDNPTIADLNLNVSANNGGVISWYDSFPNGNFINASAALIEGETYYATETDINGCESINPLEVTVTLEACDEYDIEIYDGFSPTGNGTNDTFKIKNLRELYPDFKVEFFNRWGNLIYTANAANADWNGRLNGDGELSPAGVYYFVVYFNKENKKPIQRSLYLSR